MNSTSKDDPSVHVLLQSILLELSEESSKAEARHNTIIKILEEGLRRSGAEEGVGKSNPAILPCNTSIPNSHSKAHKEISEMARRISINSELATMPERDRQIRKKQLERAYSDKTVQSWDDVATLPGWSGVRARSSFAVTSDEFETCIACLIVLNACFMAWEIQHLGCQVGYNLEYDGYIREADQMVPSAKRIFGIVDWIFGITFAIEALFKIVVMGRMYFNQAWNLVDALCVVTFVLNKIAVIVLPVSPQALRLLRLFRVVRLFRIIRRLEKLQTLYTMTTAIKGMVSILFWSVTLLAFILMTCALFLTVGLHSKYFAKFTSGQHVTREPRHIEMFQYFGTFTRCLFSMFELTLANWPPIARILTEEVSEWFQLVCVFHKIVIGFAVIGVINGVVMKETFKVAETDDVIMVRAKRREQAAFKEKLLTFFSAVDFDKSNDISLEEFYAITLSPNVQLWLNSLGIETDDFSAIFHILDKNRNGKIDLDELSTILPRVKGAARGIDVITMAARLNTQWTQTWTRDTRTKWNL